MKVFIAVDMEGATGVAHREHLMPGGNDYERARRWLTSDVNAAVEGAVRAGATDVFVNDGHGNMRNILLDELHEAARLVVGPAQSVNKPLVQVTGIEEGGFEAVAEAHADYGRRNSRAFRNAGPRIAGRQRPVAFGDGRFRL